MSGDNSCGLFCCQAFEGTCGELGECLIRGSKNGSSFNSFQSLDKAKISDKFDQSGEGTGSNGNINKVTNRGGLSRCGLGCSNNDIVNDMNDNIAGNDSFGLFRSKALKRTCGEFGKGFIRWSEDGGGLHSFQSFNKAKISDNFDQSGEGTCS